METLETRHTLTPLSHTHTQAFPPLFLLFPLQGLDTSIIKGLKRVPHHSSLRPGCFTAWVPPRGTGHGTQNSQERRFDFYLRRQSLFPRGRVTVSVLFHMTEPVFSIPPSTAALKPASNFKDTSVATSQQPRSEGKGRKRGGCMSDILLTG